VRAAVKMERLNVPTVRSQKNAHRGGNSHADFFEKMFVFRRLNED
jgi:hypothetical protein